MLRASIGLIVGIVAAALLLPCTARGPQDADSSEFVAVALRGSLAHPPGFPWFSALLAPVAHLSPASPYAALSTFNALAQATAAGLLGVLLAGLAGDVLVGGLLALSWVAWAPTLCTGTAIEVFAVHHVVCVLLVFACRAAARTNTAPWLLLVGLVAGIGGSHQPVIVFFAPWVLGVVLGGRGDRSTTRVAARLALVVGGAAIGLLPYASLPARFAHDPFHAFGHVEDLADIVHHALRVDYGVVQMNGNASATAPSAFLSLVRAALSAPLVLGAGAVFALRPSVSHERDVVVDDDAAPQAALRVPAFLTWVGLLFFAVLLRGDGDGPGLAARFFPTVALGALAASAVALAGFALRVRRGIAALAVVVAFAFVGDSVRAADAADDDYKAELLGQIFSSLPPDAFLLLDDDALVFGAEAEQARGVRPDVTVVATGRLDAWWTRERLVARHAFLASLDENERAWLGPLASAALAAGRVVAAPPSLARPAGVDSVARGPLVQWLPAGAHLVDDGLRSRCRALPSSLGKLDPARTTSWTLARAFSLAGLTERATHDDDDGRAIAAALRLYAAGDVEGARRACAAMPAAKR